MEDNRELLLEKYKDCLSHTSSVSRESLTKHCYDFLTSVQYKERFDVIDGILRKIVQKRVDTGGEVLKEIQTGLFSLESYAVNLWKFPWRKEYHTIKLYTGFYKLMVEQKLQDNESINFILKSLGYKYLNGGQDQVSLENQELEQIIRVAFDLFLTQVELEVMEEIAESVNEKGFTLGDIVKARRRMVTVEDAVILLQHRSVKRQKVEQAQKEEPPSDGHVRQTDPPGLNTPADTAVDSSETVRRSSRISSTARAAVGSSGRELKHPPRGTDNKTLNTDDPSVDALFEKRATPSSDAARYKETQEGRSQYQTFPASANIEHLDPHREDDSYRPNAARGNVVNYQYGAEMQTSHPFLPGSIGLVDQYQDDELYGIDVQGSQASQGRHLTKEEVWSKPQFVVAPLEKYADQHAPHIAAMTAGYIPKSSPTGDHVTHYPQNVGDRYTAAGMSAAGYDNIPRASPRGDNTTRYGDANLQNFGSPHTSAPTGYGNVSRAVPTVDRSTPYRDTDLQDVGKLYPSAAMSATGYDNIPRQEPTGDQSTHFSDANYHFPAATRAGLTTGYEVGAVDDPAILRSRAYPQTAQSRVLSGVNPDPYRQYNMAAQPDVMLQGTDDAAILHNHPYPPMAHSRVLSRDNSDYYSPYNTASQTDAGLQARQVPGNRREVHTDIPSRTGAHMDSTSSAGSKYGRLKEINGKADLHSRTTESSRTATTRDSVTEREEEMARQTTLLESTEVGQRHSTRNTARQSTRPDVAALNTNLQSQLTIQNGEEKIRVTLHDRATSGQYSGRSPEQKRRSDDASLLHGHADETVRSGGGTTRVSHLSSTDSSQLPPQRSSSFPRERSSGSHTGAQRKDTSVITSDHQDRNTKSSLPSSELHKTTLQGGSNPTLKHKDHTPRVTADPQADRTPRTDAGAEGASSSKDSSVAGSSQSGGYIPTTHSTDCDFCQEQSSSICRNCFNIVCSKCQQYFRSDLCAKTKGPHVFIELKGKGDGSSKSAAASSSSDQRQNTRDQGATAKPTEDWACNRCTFLNPPDHTICAICASSRDAVTKPDLPTPGSRVCRSCTFYNKEGTKVCEACHKTLDLTAPETCI